MKVLINGINYNLDSISTKIPTYYPRFDTLMFISESANSNSQIICNFKPDSTYSVSHACCGSFDIIPVSKLSKSKSIQYNPEEDFELYLDEIQNHFADKPFISIKTTEITKDTIYAWHADAACTTEHRILSSRPWELGIPPKCYYWNNITSIVFFTPHIEGKTTQEKQTASFLGFEHIKILSSVSFRFFDDQRFLIIFDEKFKTLEIVYD